MILRLNKTVKVTEQDFHILNLFNLRHSVTAVMRDVTHSLARSREALRVKKYMCSIEVENRFNARLTSSFIL